ncbi:hypothetical protein [Paracoccus aminophilus]|uniref:Uncharacterized protein n=1 Tax=Paracoccus aminophilus JCM 7686 TaxID=1367847 RepID=S5XQN3_PARAH|nr:hypothetical protein [Paracoccus aminophilus]AGT09699.1 hypothetical protein JCM7686_2642 [Paracoccus aminophilus JCM 7686]
MMIQDSQQVVFSVDSRGVVAQMDLTASREIVRQHAAAQAAIHDAAWSRRAAVLDAAAIPEECGPDIIAAPARGGFRVDRQFTMVPNGVDENGLDKWAAAPTGYGHRSAIRTADIFDRMRAQALRAKRPMVLTPGQVAMGRRYRTLVEILNADGCKLSSLEGSSGSSDGGNWMDRRLEVSSELAKLRRRIGGQDALMVRRVRPSKRAVLAAGEDPRCKFSNLDIVERVCVDDFSIGEVLRHYRWQADGRNKKALLEALRGALVRMEGY